MVSTTGIAGYDWRSELEGTEFEKGALEFLSLRYILGDKANDALTRILIVTGTHGTREGDTILTKTKEYLVKHCGNDGSQFYAEDCRHVGIDPSANPVPGPKPMSPNAKPYSLLKKFGTKIGNMSFDIVDLSRFHNDKDGFAKYVNTFKPTIIILAFCFSKNSDVYNFC